MPQKKNPDIFELTRGKTGFYIANLMGLLTTLKGLPSIYDKDLQEDKQYVFSSFDTILMTVPALAGGIQTLTPVPEKMLNSIDPSMLATDIADFLVKHGVPFREAHHIVGKIVQHSIKNEISIQKIPVSDLIQFHPVFKDFTDDILSPQQSIENRGAIGGTSSKTVAAQIKQALEIIKISEI